MKMGAVPPYSYNDIVSHYILKFKAQFAEKLSILHLFFHAKPIDKQKRGGDATSFNCFYDQTTSDAIAVATRPSTRTTARIKHMVLFTQRHPRTFSSRLYYCTSR